MERRPLNIRAIQHYLYCPRRFGLTELDDSWAENAFTVSGDIIHERVHSGENTGKCRNGMAYGAVTLYNDELDIYGVSDCIELERSDEGDYTAEDGRRYFVNIVEYKPTKPKNDGISLPDSIQVFAQKICADSIFHVNSRGYLYYADVRRRTLLPFDTEYDKYFSLIKELTDGMRAVLESGEIPKRKKGQKCAGCSMKDICMPVNGGSTVYDMINSMRGDGI